MSEEEKKAIEAIKADYELAIKEDSLDIDVFTVYLGTALNLIENQQREIYNLEQELEQWRPVQTIAEQQKEIEALKDKNNNLANIKIAEWQDALTNAISKDKLKENFAKDIAFKKRLDRQGERIDQYNKGRFDVIEEILELLEE